MTPVPPDERELAGRRAAELQWPAPDVENATRPILTLLLRLTGLDSVCLTRFDMDEGRQEVLVAAGSPDTGPSFAEGAARPWHETLCRRVLLDDRPAWTDDCATTFPELGPAAGGGGAVRTFFSCPVVLDGGRLFGSICGVSARAVAFDADVYDVVRQMSRALAGELEEEARHRRREAEMEALDAMKSRFLSHIAHELRGPLTVLGGYLGLIGEGLFGELPAELLQVLETLMGRVREMDLMVNQMSDAARLEDSHLELVVERADLVELVRSAYESARHHAAATHRLSLALPAEPVEVDVDVLRTTSIVINLVRNALKYSPRGGEVSVTLEVDEGRASVRVADQGIGIDDAGLARLFTPYGRVATGEHARIPGTGMGLYLSREVARRQQGDIEVASDAGAGSRFTLVLPCARTAERVGRRRPLGRPAGARAGV